MVIQGDISAKEGQGMSRIEQSEDQSVQRALADHDSQVEIESVEKKRRRGGWITAPFIFGCETADALAGFGSRANLIIFMTKFMHLKKLRAAMLLNVFSAMTAVTSLLGAFLADAYLGRFTTIALGSCINFSGLLTLTMVAWNNTLHPPACTESNAGACQKSSTLQLGVVLLGFALMALGSGGIRPCVGPFGASQFDQTHPQERKQLKHYFNWYFFTLSFAMLLGSTIIVYIQENVGWTLGFGIPATAVLLSLAFFFGGIRLYRYSPPRGSPFTRMAQVIVAAFLKRKLTLPEDPTKLYYGDANENGHDSEDLEKSDSGDDDDEAAVKTVAQLNHSVNDAKSPSVGRANLAEGVDAVLGGKIFNANSDQEKSRLGKTNAEISKPEETNEEFDVKQNGHEKVFHEKNDAVEKHLESSREAMASGPEYKGEGEDHSMTVICHSDQFRYFDKAAVAVPQDWCNSYGKDGQNLKSRLSPWRLCSVQQVEELKCVVRLAPMWATVIPLALVTSTERTYGVVQADTMDRKLGHFVIPAASFSVFSTITVLIWLPIYDKKIAPALKRYIGKEITFLQKIAVGMGLQILGHTVTTLVEHRRRKIAHRSGLVDKPQDTVPISAFWLLPQHVIGGLSDSFMMVGHIEFFYYMLPEHLTTTGSALFLTATTIGASLNTVLLDVVEKVTTRPGHPGWLTENINKAHLDYFYGLLTLTLALNFVFYLVVARWYKRQETKAYQPSAGSITLS